MSANKKWAFAHSFLRPAPAHDRTNSSALIVRLAVVLFKSRRPVGYWLGKGAIPMTAATTVLNPYASFLGEQEPLAVIAATPERLKALTEKIGPAKLETPPAPDKWSAREILCHLADCEIAFGFRLRQTLAEDNHTIQPFDQDKWAAPYANLSANEALAAFSAVRRWNSLLVQGALEEFAGKAVTHPERGAMTFATIVETMAGHDLNHIGQLQRIAG
jgi:DinB superfamily